MVACSWYDGSGAQRCSERNHTLLLKSKKVLLTQCCERNHTLLLKSKKVQLIQSCKNRQVFLDALEIF